MPGRAGLDREVVVRAAAALADARGLDTLTLGELAAHLGIRTPSLYNHVAGLEGLRRDLALLGTHELNARLTRAAVGKAGDAAIIAVADAYRGFAHAHPGLYAAALRAPEPNDTERNAVAEDLIGTIAAVLADYGLAGDDALHAIRMLRSTLHGFVALEAAGGFGLPLDRDETFRRLVRMLLDGLRHEQRRQETPGADSMPPS